MARTVCLRLSKLLCCTHISFSSLGRFVHTALLRDFIVNVIMFLTQNSFKSMWLIRETRRTVTFNKRE